MAFDSERCRQDFPVLAEKVNGKPLVYLDSAASAQKPHVVIQAMSAMMETAYANVHRGLHYLSNEATSRFERARTTAQAFLGARYSEEVIFTRNATEAFNLLAYSFLAPELKEGDEIVLSLLEHHSNIVPWHFLRERYGARLVWVPVTDQGEVRFEDVQAAISPRTRLITLTQMSNALGTITPIDAVAELAKSKGIPFVIDGSQGAVHLPVNVSDLDCDFYICTGHKLYGPSGIGLLYGKKAHLDTMTPFLGGGEMIDVVSQDSVTYASAPHRFEAGTPAIVEAEGLHFALDYINQLGKPAIIAHEKALTDYARERFRGLSRFSLIGDHPNKGAIFSFVHDQAHAHDISMIIDQEGVAVRAGTHCTMPLLQYFGVSATCRASFGVYNSFDDVDRLMDALEKVNRFF